MAKSRHGAHEGGISGRHSRLKARTGGSFSSLGGAPNLGGPRGAGAGDARKWMRSSSIGPGASIALGEVSPRHQRVAHAPVLGPAPHWAVLGRASRSIAARRRSRPPFAFRSCRSLAETLLGFARPAGGPNSL